MRTNVSQRIVQLSNTIGEQACCHCILELLLSGDTETENYECFNITCRMYGCGVYVCKMQWLDFSWNPFLLLGIDRCLRWRVIHEGCLSPVCHRGGRDGHRLQMDRFRAPSTRFGRPNLNIFGLISTLTSYRDNQILVKAARIHITYPSKYESVDFDNNCEDL